MISSHNNASIDCGGILSCSNSSILIASGTIDCNGDHSCARSNISLNININTNTSNESTTHTVSTIQATGSYSLKSATITVSSAGNVSIELIGYYSGYNALIICQNNSQCNIKCYGNGCYNTTVNCTDNISSNCNIDCSNLHLQRNSIYCARMVGDSVTSVSQETAPMDLTATENLVNIVELTKSLDESCSNVYVYHVYDDYSELFLSGTIAMSSGICCRGSDSCSTTSYLHVSDENNDIVCSGKGSCELASSLRTSLVSGSGSVICGGYQSCQSAKLRASEDGTIYCGGSRSCHDGEVLDASGNSLYCTGGKDACSKAIINGIPNVYILAGYGGKGNSGLLVDSNGIDAPYIVNVSLLAYQAGSNVDIRCRVLNTCNIFCYIPGACDSSTTVDCNDGECHVYCDAQNGIDCGTVNGSYTIHTWTTTSVPRIPQSTTTRHMHQREMLSSSTS